MQIKDVMSPNCSWVAPNCDISEAAQMMKDQDIGFLPVGENDKLVGTITDRDIVLRAVAKSSQAAQVRDVMTEQLYYCFDDQTVDEICNNLSDIKVRRLPVVNRDKRLVGVVSLGNLSQAQAQQSGQTLQSITEDAQAKSQAA